MSQDEIFITKIEEEIATLQRLREGLINKNNLNKDFVFGEWYIRNGHNRYYQITSHTTSGMTLERFDGLIKLRLTSRSGGEP